MRNHPLKTGRVILAATSLTAVTLLLSDISGSLHRFLGWMARIQLWPAVLALNIGVIIALAALTLVFGRIYCSVICPLGIWQDLVSRAAGKGRKHFSFLKEKKVLRYLIWVVFVAASIAGAGALAALLDPYSVWGRSVQNLLQPVYTGVNNLLALGAERIGSYAFYSHEIWLRSLPTFAIALCTIILVSVLAARNGRSWCNDVCPVGTTLSLLSRFSLFKPVIDSEHCKDCKACERACKSQCIDIASHKIDYSRCVDCFNCLGSCKFDALHYRFSPLRAKKGSRGPGAPDKGRRAFLAGAATVAAGTVLKAQDYKVDGGLAEIERKQVPERHTKITPPGSEGADNMYSRCTACQLCVAQCPSGVLRPSTDLRHLMQPESSYERGWCRPECTVCSEVCPTGAIKPLTREQKTAVHIGHAVVLRQNCICSADGVQCNNCARHCPAGAITMVPADPQDETGILIPSINTERCIGCGACENLCPARPMSAIFVEGYKQHIIS